MDVTGIGRKWQDTSLARKERRIMNEILIIFLLSFTIIPISGCLQNSNEKDSDNAEISVGYIIKISNVNGFNEIVIPRIINLYSDTLYSWNVTDVTDIDNFILTTGTGSISDNESEFGLGVKITFSSDVNIEYHESYNIEYNPPYYIDPHYILNLEQNANYDNYPYSNNCFYYIYCENSNNNTTIKISFSYEKQIGKSLWVTEILINSILQNGWNIVEGSMSTLTGD